MNIAETRFPNVAVIGIGLEAEMEKFMALGREAKSLVTDSPKKDETVAQMTELAKTMVKHENWAAISKVFRMSMMGKVVDLINHMAGQ